MLQNWLICKKILDDFYTFIIGDDPKKLDEFISRYETKEHTGNMSIAKNEYFKVSYID